VEDRLIQLVKLLMTALKGVLIICALILCATFYFNYLYDPSHFDTAAQPQIAKIDSADVKEGVHQLTGLKIDTNLELVVANCTGCHSAKLITQNRATALGWKGIITWMQETQNLPNLGDNEEKIISYLAKNYAPESQGRRKPLENIEWYELK